MNQKTKGFALLVLAGMGLMVYFFTMPAKDIAGQASEFSVSAEELFLAFQGGDSLLIEKYMGQVVTVEGIPSSVTERTLLLKPGVACALSDAIGKEAAGTLLRVKGRVVGFDPLFGEVQLDFVTQVGE